MPAPIAMVTDFGSLDPYVGIMKGVIQTRAPGAPLIDLTHEIPPGDLLRAAVVLWQSVPYFPPGTVFLVVVDPGVGTERKPVLVESGPYRFIAPDNGVLTFVLRKGWRAWVLENPLFRLETVSTTFHGRDIFAPAAAHAAQGLPGDAFGPPVEELVTLPPVVCRFRPPGHLQGQVLYADRFGNVLTSLGTFRPLKADVWLFRPWQGEGEERRLRFRALELPSGRTLSWVRTFGDLPEGQPGFLVGSTGLIEIVVNRASAQDLLGLERGQPLILHVEEVD